MLSGILNILRHISVGEVGNTGAPALRLMVPLEPLKCMKYIPVIVPDVVAVLG